MKKVLKRIFVGIIDLIIIFVGHIVFGKLSFWITTAIFRIVDLVLHPIKANLLPLCCMLIVLAFFMIYVLPKILVIVNRMLLKEEDNENIKIKGRIEMKNLLINTFKMLVYVGIVFGGVQLADYLATRDFWMDFFSGANPENAGVLLIAGVFLAYPIVLGVVVPFAIVIVNYIFDRFLMENNG
ncbi:MAG: hypothetical protein IJ867_01020 [Clostridia bacterium]|nr:hypothetical protein [Clostridia bacterium]